MKKTKPAAEHSQELLKDLQALGAEASKLVGDEAGEQTERAIAALREQLDEAGDRFTELYGQAKKKTIAGAKYTDQAVRDNPYQSIAIISGVALLIGLLIGRTLKSD